MTETTELALVVIRLDGGTQVRAAIDDAVVADYAEQMLIGAVFPPIVVFLDGQTFHLADGYHRYLAVQRLGGTTIEADVQHGTRDDALWFALGANRTNGQRLTDVDKTHAVKLALATWPDCTNKAIALQVGCSQSLVSKTVTRLDAANTTGGLRGLALINQRKREAVRAMVQAGESSTVIRKALHAHSTTIANARRELGLSVVDYSRKASRERRDRIRELAAEGQTSRQIAADLGLTEEGCRAIIRKDHISVPADVVTQGLHRHDPNRIMARIVADAEDLSAGVNLIDFAALDPAPFTEWIATLRQARATLGMFIKRLKQEQSHVKDASSHAIEDTPSADFPDPHPNGAGDPARISQSAR